MLRSMRRECEEVLFPPSGDEILCLWRLSFLTYLVHGHQQTQRADTQTGDETTHHNLVPFVCRGDLHDNAYAHNGTPERNAGSAPDPVSNRGSDESTEQRSDGQQRYDETTAHIGEVVCTICVSLTKAAHKVRHAEEAGNLTSVLSVKCQVSVCIVSSS
jgi:hypothetical protein